MSAACASAVVLMDLDVGTSLGMVLVEQYSTN